MSTGKIVKLTLLLLVFFLASKGSASAQSSRSSEASKLKDYRENPRWIKMKEDPAINYFEAVKAFDEFWKNRKAPVEDDVIGEDHKEKEQGLLKKVFARKEAKEEQEMEEYRFEYKKFKHWQLTVEPYVQPDGRILTSEEQLEIWKSQRK